MTAADVLAAIGRGLAFGAVWLLIAFAIALIIGRASDFQHTRGDN